MGQQDALHTEYCRLIRDQFDSFQLFWISTVDELLNDSHITEIDRSFLQKFKNELRSIRADSICRNLHVGIVDKKVLSDIVEHRKTLMIICAEEIGKSNRIAEYFFKVLIEVNTDDLKQRLFRELAVDDTFER